MLSNARNGKECQGCLEPRRCIFRQGAWNGGWTGPRRQWDQLTPPPQYPSPIPNQGRPKLASWICASYLVPGRRKKIFPYPKVTFIRSHKMLWMQCKSCGLAAPAQLTLDCPLVTKLALEQLKADVGAMKLPFPITISNKRQRRKKAIGCHTSPSQQEYLIRFH